MSIELNLDTFKPVLKLLGSGVAPGLERVLTAMLAGASGPFGLLVEPALNMLWPQINAALGLEPDSPPWPSWFPGKSSS